MIETDKKTPLLDIEKTTSLRGILAILVVLHHLAQGTDIYLFSDIFSEIGPHIVAMFFFLSGYGLFYSYRKKPSYLESFLLKRLSRILIPFILTIILFQLFRILDSQEINVSNIFGQLIKGNTNYFLPFSWYVFVSIFLYLVFYLIFKDGKIKISDKLILLLFILACYVIFAKLVHLGSWWFQSIFAFFFGFLFVHYEEKINIFQKNAKYLLLLYLTILILIRLFGFEHYISLILSPSLIYLVLIRKKVFSIPVFSQLGKIAYEIYLVQGIAILSLRSSLINITSDLAYIFACLLLIIPLAIIINQFSGILLRKLIMKHNR